MNSIQCPECGAPAHLAANIVPMHHLVGANVYRCDKCEHVHWVMKAPEQQQPQQMQPKDS